VTIRTAETCPLRAVVLIEMMPLPPRFLVGAVSERGALAVAPRGTVILEIRNSLRMTRAQLAQLLGIHAQSVDD
jgi:hypothetical protein